MRWVCAGLVAIHDLGRHSNRLCQMRRCPGPPCHCWAHKRPLKGGRSPQPSEGQQCLQLWIQGWLRLLGLTLSEQIIEEPGEPDQTPAPALLTEPDQQAIAAGRKLKATGGVGVSEGHGGRSAGRHLQHGAGSRTRDDPPMCRVMRHHRQPAAGMAPILDAAPHHEEACAAAMSHPGKPAVKVGELCGTCIRCREAPGC